MNNNTRVENLLTQIYSQVDLKEDVFEYLQPYVLKAYALLRNDQLNLENGKAGDVLFQNPEHKNAIENILFRDLPGFVDIYTQLPLDYRNEKIVKENKTHRDLLIENVEILSQQLKLIEHNAYEIYDKRMSVSNRFIKERYNETDFTKISGTEVEKENGIENKFNWNKFKQTIIPKTMKELTDRNFTKEGDNNTKIVLTENHIEYQVKDKFRHFMAGTYNIYQKAQRKMKDSASWLGENWFAAVCLTSMVSVIAVPLSMGIYSSYQSRTAHQLEETSNIVNTTNPQLKEISIGVLNEFTKNNYLEITYTPDKNAVYIYKNIDKNKCMHTIEYFQNNYRRNNFHYSINGMELESTKPLNDQLQEGVCNLETNKVSVGWSLKLK